MISLLKTKVVLHHFFSLPFEFKHMRPEVSDPIVQRFRGSEVQRFRGSVRTYCTYVHTSAHRHASGLRRIYRLSAHSSGLKRPGRLRPRPLYLHFPVFVLRVCSFHFQFHSSWASLLVKAVLGAGCFAMKSEVQETEGLVRDPVSSTCMYLLMTEIADRGSWIVDRTNGRDEVASQDWGAAASIILAARVRARGAMRFASAGVSR